MNFQRQERIFNPEEQKTKLIVVGCGSVGSFTILNLCKLGFNNIVAIDFDKVSVENIPNQFYRIKDVDRFKTEALKEIVKEFTDTDISVVTKKIDDDYPLPELASIDMNTIVIFALDSLEARKIIYEQIKEYPIKLIDMGMGGEQYNIYVVNLNSEQEKREYEKTFSYEESNLPCGEKSIIYTILSIASEVTNIIKRIDKNETYPKSIDRAMTSYKIVGGIASIVEVENKQEEN